MERDLKCEERIGKELEWTIARIRNAARFDEIVQEYDFDRDENLIAQLLKARHEGQVGAVEARELYDELQKMDLEERGIEEYAEGLLGIDRLYTVYRVQMSWGGPSDEFQVFIDSNGDIDHIDYVFKDWFDGARRTLYGSDLAVAEELVEYLKEWMVMQ